MRTWDGSSALPTGKNRSAILKSCYLSCGRFTYSSIFAAQNLTAANLAVYWGLTRVWQIIIFYFVTPGIMVGINLVGVGTFGWIEAVGGCLKIALVIGTTIVLYVMAADSKSCLFSLLPNSEEANQTCSGLLV